MNNGSFIAGLGGLSGWLGNLILPTIAGFCVIIAIIDYRNHRHVHFSAALLCLMGPACALLVRSFVTRGAPAAAPGADVYAGALMNALNWVGNVIMPIFAALNVARGVISIGGFMKPLFTSSGEDHVHYFVVAFGCLMVSGILRLLEHFVLTAKAVSILSIPLHGGALQWLCA